MRSTRDELHRKIARLEAERNRLRELLKEMVIPDWYKLSDLMLADKIVARNRWIHDALAEIDGADPADG